jgi:hypothetical protein
MYFFFRFLIATLFLILIYIIYRSEIYWGGSNRDFYLIYLIATCVVIFFLIICTFLNVKIQKYIIIIFISTIFTLYSFEGKLTLDKKKTDLNYDIRKVYEDLKKTNLNVTVTASPHNFLTFNKLDFLSLAGISKAKTILCNESGYFSIYQSDRYGFNNPDTEWDSKEIEYLLVGDSFTHGNCVNRPNDIASILRKYSKKNTLNLGQMGNGPLIEYATLREYFSPNIKNVLWLYYEGNDLFNLENELKNNILNKYLTDQKFKQDLKLKQTKVNQFLTNFLERERERERGREIIKFIKLTNIRSLLILTPSPPPPPELKIILKLANELVKSHNGKLYFIYLPSFERYTRSLKVDFKQEIKNIVSNLGIEFIDIDEEVFKKENNPLKLFPFERFNHYNVEGYKKVALKIYEKTK